MIALDYQLARLDDLDNFNPLFIHNQLSQLWELLASLDRQVQELKKENAELRKAVAPAIALPEMGESLIRSVEGPDAKIEAWRVEGGPMPNIEDDPCARLEPSDFDYVPVEGEAWTPFDTITYVRVYGVDYGYRVKWSQSGRSAYATITSLPPANARPGILDAVHESIWGDASNWNISVTYIGYECES